MAPTLHLDRGTLRALDLPPAYAHRALAADARSGGVRGPAHAYAEVVASWRAAGLPFVDEAARFGPLPPTAEPAVTPFPHQAAALSAWEAAGRRGLVELPTGAGKTLLAVWALRRAAVATLIVVPTIDLLHQWHQVLHQHLGLDAALLGGGSRATGPLCVATYDSAAREAERLGGDFGLLVCDECHHLPAPAYRFIAAASVAPFRLGLTATLARSDGGEATCAALLGPPCYRVDARALGGTYLAPYDVERIDVAMDAEEAAAYAAARQTYTDFLRAERIHLGGPYGWAQFLARAQRSPAGRAAIRAYRTQRRLALGCAAKIALLWELLARHCHDRCIVFTDDNEMVYRLGRAMLLPVITHHTPPAERRAILADLAAGSTFAVLTSRVLNEGIDVPAANVGVVLSGSGSAREHVQRLGRLLRRQPGKRARLYELVSDTRAERGISDRRRQHPAYAPC